MAPIAVGEHTMPVSRLRRYLGIKVHHLIRQRDWDRIHLVGGYDRGPGAVVSTTEKSGKRFNTERPTARAAGGELTVQVYPGADYVHHYALIVATYLAVEGRVAGHVTYERPGSEVTRAAVAALRLDLDGDLVVLGWGLDRLAPAGATWTRGPGYAWTSARVHGTRVIYLGFTHSIWGDVAGCVVARLAQLGAGAVVYVGKVGALAPDVAPNEWLASGDRSRLHGRTVAWQDFFGEVATAQPGVRTGVHVSSPSVLLEDRAWLRRHTGCAVVDPEIGPMGAAAHTAGIPFGYLHVISNNLARAYPADLSNERTGEVVHRRAALLDRIRAILTARLAEHRT